MPTNPDPVERLHLSFLTPIGYQTSSCGYCKGPSSGASYYAATKKLTARDYQALVDRGWRRSGTLLYKPDNRLSCCPQYTIRIPVADFKTRKDQRAALHRWNRYVLGEEYIRETSKARPKTKEEKKRQRNEFDLRTAVHEAEHSNIPITPQPAHRFEVALEEDNFTKEKFELFRHYQEHVHHEPKSHTTPASFRRFLCDSPLPRESEYDHSTGKIKHLGSFHQTYRLDGRLIAIGVLDLLPHCVSGVYFIYHADFEKYSFGKLSACREACMALEDSYGHYYMGYYIHSCAKMRYKNDYQPQHFLDLEDMTWYPIDAAILDLMGRQKNVSVSRERANAQEQADESKATDEDETMRDHSPMDTSVETDAHAPAYSNAKEAEKAGASALIVGMPGVMTAAEVEAQIDLDDVNIQISRDVITKTSNIVSWDQGTVQDSSSLKGAIAELAGCVGPDVMKPDRMVVRFMRN